MANGVVLWVIVYFCVTSVNTKDTITYRPGVDNVGPDTLARAFCASVTETNSNISKIHNGRCHPGVTRILHFVRLRNLPYSTE